MSSLTEDALKLAEVFNEHVDEHGHIHKEDLKAVFFEIGMSMPADMMDTLLQEMDVNDDGVIDLREFVTWVTHEGDSASHIPQRSHVSQATPERQSGRAKHVSESTRVRMECQQCGYKSYPQWLNDQAHCLKCDHVVKTRPSCHDKDAAAYKKAHYVQSASANDAQAAAARLPTTPVTAASGGGKVFADDDPAPDARSRAIYGAATAKKRNERVKMECPRCGYKSIPQWMNDQAHCLKCDMVIKKQQDIFGRTQ